MTHSTDRERETASPRRQGQLPLMVQRIVVANDNPEDLELIAQILRDLNIDTIARLDKGKPVREPIDAAIPPPVALELMGGAS